MPRTRVRRAQRLFGVMMTAAAAITACSSAAETTSGPRLRMPLGLEKANDANPVVASLTGHWEVRGSLGNLNKFSVSAIQRLDGTVTGEIQYERESPQHEMLLKAHADVICVTVEGNTARVAVVGDQLDLTTGVTTHGFGYFTAVDNGEGANDPPDRGSNLFGTSSETRARSHCTAPLIADARIFPSERGNVQVRSGI